MPDYQPVSSWRLSREVHHIRHLARFLKLFHDAHSLSRNRLLGLIGRRADMMRTVKSLLFDDLILKLSRRARRLNCIDVQAGANVAFLHRRG
jgi:hypothetical protein